MAGDVPDPEAETGIRLLPEASRQDLPICRAGLTCAGSLLCSGYCVDIWLLVPLGDVALWQGMFPSQRKKPKGSCQKSPGQDPLSFRAGLTCAGCLLCTGCWVFILFFFPSVLSQMLQGICFPESSFQV